jgi:hypothetical protein
MNTKIEVVQQKSKSMNELNKIIKSKEEEISLNNNNNKK